MSKQGNGINTEKRKETYIVSLTSFPGRINDIWITVETILRQSVKPDKIILWLAEEQFPDRKLPEILNRQIDRGLTVNYGKDLRSHKKYYYSLLNYPKAKIITLDDDVYYPKDVIKNLIELHEEYPDLVVANRAHKITVRNGKVNPYGNWKHNVGEITPSHLLIATGIGGILYPPGVLNEEVFNAKLFKELCFHADDIWLKVMELKNGAIVATNRRFNKSFVSVGSTQTQKLTSRNILDGGNDVQLNNLLNHFKIDLLNYFR